LPAEAAQRRALSGTVLGCFERHGYTLVSTPPFERIDLLERAGTLRHEDVLQFVDADGGDVAMFRPDITPQIARLVASRLRDWPGPYRLSYEGHVIRRPRGRARRQRQIPQAGIELIGVPGPEAEAEVLAIAAAALFDVGLTDHVVELSFVPLVRSLLVGAPEALATELTEALARKDLPALRELASPLGKDGERIVELAQLWGGTEVVAEARRLFGKTARVLAPLQALIDAASARGLARHLRVDLGEVRGFGYYTGPSFALLAEGPGEPIGGGGRYDELLGRFGRPLPGAGFALDLDHLAWAVSSKHGEAPEAARLDCVVSRTSAAVPPGGLAEPLRAAGLRVAELGPDVDALAWARAWSVPWVLELSPKAHRLREAKTGRTSLRGSKAPADLAARIRARIGANEEAR
jgi:ATP phosphoribosyltransferase regulatory subunit